MKYTNIEHLFVMYRSIASYITNDYIWLLQWVTNDYTAVTIMSYMTSVLMEVFSYSLSRNHGVILRE